MKIFIVFICVILLSKTVTSQAKEINLIAAGGISQHGTGDLSGYTFLNQIDIRLAKRFFLSPGVQFTNHSKAYMLSRGIQLNFVTSGVNIFTDINYLILNRSRHRIAVGAGPVLRFENSSYPLEFGINVNANNEQVLLLKNDKLRSVSVGYNVTPSYYYQIDTRLFLGAKFIFQNDTKGDVITSATAFICVKL